MLQIGLTHMLIYANIIIICAHVSYTWQRPIMLILSGPHAYNVETAANVLLTCTRINLHKLVNGPVMAPCVKGEKWQQWSNFWIITIIWGPNGLRHRRHRRCQESMRLYGRVPSTFRNTSNTGRHKSDHVGLQKWEVQTQGDISQ